MLKAIILTFLISMVPVIELRGALPAGVAMGLSPLLSTTISIIGNLIPVPFILLLMPIILKWMKKQKFTKKFAKWLEDKVAKHRDKIDKYGWLGLVILVAIPLPGTGAWTGSLVASCLEIKKKPAFFAIAAGVIIAGIIVLAIAYGFTQIL